VNTTARSLVEVVIPTYNRPRSLRHAVESALAETPFNVTILDDAAPDPVEGFLDIDSLSTDAGRVRIVRNAFNLGASLNILNTLHVSRAPFTWPVADDQVIRSGAGTEVINAIAKHTDAVILFWHCGLPTAESFDLTGLAEFIDLIERGRQFYGFTDVFFNRVLKTEVGRRYLRLDAHFAHAQPMLGIQLAALADGLPVHISAGALSNAHEDADSGWSTAYAERFKLDLAYLIPDAHLRARYRAVVGNTFPWREALLDLSPDQRGSIDEEFALDAARLVALSPGPRRLRIEARLGLFLRMSSLGRVLGHAVPKKRVERRDMAFRDTKW
jgi:hypothetical protein